MTTQSTPSFGTVGQARTGPMPTAGRWGWYRDHEGNEYRRVSKLITKVETDTYNLERWKLRQVALGMAARDNLVLSLKAMREPETGWTSDDKRKINGIAEEAMKAAETGRGGARHGTAVHDLTERLDRGEALETLVRGLPAAVAEAVRAYAFLRRENDWRQVEIERTVVCDELEVAGTFDRVDLIPGLAALLGPGDCQYGHAAAGLAHDPGPDSSAELPVINDVKTEAAPWLNGLHIAPQLAIYSRAKRMWRPTGGTVPLLDKDGTPKLYPNSGDPIMLPAGEYVPAPCVRQDVAVVVHIHEGRATPYFINLAEGWEAAQAAYAQINREARAKRSLGRAGAWFAEVPGVKRPRVAEMLVAQAASRDVMTGHALPTNGNLVTQSGEHGIAAPMPGTLASALVDASRNTAGMVAVRRGDGMTEWVPANGCMNCAPLVANASLTRVDGTEGDESCHTCGARGPAAEPAIGTQVEVGGLGFTKVDTMANVAQLGALDEVDRSAVEAVWAKSDLAGLAVIYDIYTKTVGRPWGGRVAEAAEARRRQIECVQRELHAGPGKCACGWTTGLPV